MVGQQKTQKYKSYLRRTLEKFPRFIMNFSTNAFSIRNTTQKGPLIQLWAAYNPVCSMKLHL